MKLVLCSSGFFTPEIVAKTVELVGKPQSEIRIAVINEAYAVGQESHSWVVDELSRINDNFRNNLYIVDLLALTKEQIHKHLSAADVVYVMGGPTDYEMHILTKTGVIDMLPELLDSKVYVGSSAGSMVLGKRVPTEVHATVYGEDDTYGIAEYLGLVDMAIMPHLGSDHFPNCNQATLQDIAAKVDAPIYGLADDTAIIIDGDSMSLVGDNYIRI